MTGQEAFRTALSLLGYSDIGGDGMTGGDGVYRRALPFVNQIAAELWYDRHAEAYVPLTSLSATVPLDARTAQTVLPYGVAMLLAAAEGDPDNQTLYAGYYDGRRVAGPVERVHDVLPVTGE